MVQCRYRVRRTETFFFYFASPASALLPREDMRFAEFFLLVGYISRSRCDLHNCDQEKPQKAGPHVIVIVIVVCVCVCSRKTKLEARRPQVRTSNALRAGRYVADLKDAMVEKPLYLKQNGLNS